MRNPMNSWNKSDSAFMGTEWGEIIAPDVPVIGINDMSLINSLIKAGPSHRKFLRQIMVWWDIKAPRYVWQELDTYKVATVRNSCSTMHKLGYRNIGPDDFQDGEVMSSVLDELNRLAQIYRGGGHDHKVLRLMKQILPEGFLQEATYTFSYETGMSMYLLRRAHRLSEWSGPGGICETIKALPYMEQFLEAIT
jgi:hypothetical protein